MMRAVVLGALAAASGVVAQQGLTTTQPNFIFVLADDWGLGDTGAYHTLLSNGIDAPATPQLDRMAREGTRFTDFHTLGAECSPSRASWTTGRSPSDSAVRIHLVIGGHADNVKKGCADYLNTSTPTVFSMLHDAGYSVGHFGKWHLGDTPANVSAGRPAAPGPDGYGVDKFRCYACNAPDAAHSYDLGDLWFPSNSSRMIVDDGLAFIASAKAARKPFYLNLWFHISHAPMLPTTAQLERFASDVYNTTDPVTLCNGPNQSPHKGGYVTCSSLVYRASQYEADTQIGRLLDYLRADKELDSQTLLIFSGDNGPEDPHIYMHSVGDPGPYRGRKRSLYDGGTHMAMLARWPGTVPAGVVSAAQIMSADWLPTVAAFAGVAVPTDPAGSQVVPFGEDRSGDFSPQHPRPKARTLPIMFDYRADGYGHCWNQAPRLALLDGPMKFLMNVGVHGAVSRVELYNLTAHPFEGDNLADSVAPSVLQTYQQQLLEWIATTDPVREGTMGATSKHLGCDAYQGGQQVGMAARAESEERPFDWQYRQ
eukprot:m.166777 g.166777  ORF g.166777 m.166777 type:complete len:539 (+) comp24061_c1_seq1:76-1692(+)